MSQKLNDSYQVIGWEVLSDILEALPEHIKPGIHLQIAEILNQALIKLNPEDQEYVVGYAATYGCSNEEQETLEKLIELTKLRIWEQRKKQENKPNQFGVDHTIQNSGDTISQKIKKFETNLESLEQSLQQLKARKALNPFTF